MSNGVRQTALGLVTMVSAAGLTACATSVGSTNGETESYKVGYVASLSGAGSVFADNGLQSAELAVQEIQDSGIVPGEVEVIQVDDAGDPSTAQQVCSRLVLKEKVDVIIGFQNSANRGGCLPVAERAGVPYMYATPYEGGECADNFFVLGEVPKQQIDPLVQHMTDAEGADSWYLAGSDYIAMTAGNEYAREVITSAGGTVVGEQYAPIETTEFGPVINEILGSGADTAMVSFIGTDFIAFLKQWKTTPGADAVRLATFGLPIGAGDAVEDLFTAFSYFPSIASEDNAEYRDGLDVKFEGKAQLPSILSVVNYDAVWMWALAVEEAGTRDLDAVTTALKEVTFDGPRGPVSFNDQGHANLPMHIATLNGDPLEGGEQVLSSVPPTEPGDQCS